MRAAHSVNSTTDLAPDESGKYRWLSQSCPLCPTSNSRLLGRRGGDAHRLGLGLVSFVYKCKSCGLIFPDPMPVPSEMAQHYGDAEKYFAEHVLEEKIAAHHTVLHSIEQLGAIRGRLLDIGTGRGEMLKAATDRGWKAVGLEPSGVFARFAREYSGAEVVEAKLEDRPFETDSFDVVTLGAVLEHVFDPVRVLMEINRVLRPGGMLWLDVPNEAGTFYRLGNLYQRLRGRDWVVNLSPTFPPYHVFGFTPRAIRSLAEVSGFKVVRLKTYAAGAVIETRESPVPPLFRPVIKWLLGVSERIGGGTYMDVWAIKQ